MDCRNVEEAILDALENTGPACGQREIDAHLAGCPACTAFAAHQKSLDARLGKVLAPPEMNPEFRKTLRNRIRQEAIQSWADSLPDRVHFLSCGFATVLCAIAMPFNPAAVLSVGAAATVVTYILLTAVRTLFESTEESGQ